MHLALNRIASDAPNKDLFILNFDDAFEKKPEATHVIQMLKTIHPDTLKVRMTKNKRMLLIL